MKAMKILGMLWILAILMAANAHARETAKEIILGCATSFLPSSVWVAEDKGYFEGLNVKIREFNSGKTALDTMLNQGNLDMVTVAQTPVMFNSFKRSDFVILAAMVYSDESCKVLARRDKGITKPSDLKGRKVGITRGSTGHFFLGLFLIYNDMDLSDVHTVDMEATALPQSLAEGRVDAISVWEPHIVTAKQLLGENGLILSKRGIFREDFYFVAKRKFAQNNVESLRRFLKAIQSAEKFIRTNREESIDIVSNRLKMNRELTALVWDEFDFRLILDQSILISLEHQARWAIREGLVENKGVPNYLKFIYMDPLEQVAPEAVTIIR